MCIQIMDVTTDPSRALFCQPTVAANERLGKTREDEMEERVRARDAARADMEEAVAPDRIRAVQLMLNSLGYPCGTPHGVFGDLTRYAVLDYQWDQGLEITGLINDSLVRHLETQVADL